MRMLISWIAVGLVAVTATALAGVNVKTGNFYLPVQDVYLPCYGYPLEVTRTYNSVSTRVGPFGYGWNFNYDLRISAAADKKLTVVEPDGYVNTYDPVDADP